MLTLIYSGDANQPDIVSDQPDQTITSSSAYYITIPQQYKIAFSRRGVDIAFRQDLGEEPLLFSEIDSAAIRNKQSHCFWACSEDDMFISEENLGCAWFWHQGPAREQLEKLKHRLILIPRIDLLRIRYLPPTARYYRAYRVATSRPWEEKIPELYFLGHNTGIWHNSRLKACRLIRNAGIPASIGLLPRFLPDDALSQSFAAAEQPLYQSGQYRYILSLWGNHPFNPRLFRGLEAGALVFHQVTPDVVQLHDEFLIPGEHYVPIQPDLSDLIDKLDYYLSHEAEAREIAANGRRQWQQTLFIQNPYDITELLWERFTSQPGWKQFLMEFDIH